MSMTKEETGERASGGRVMSSAYMLWAKARSHARYNLASSGLLNYRLSELPVRLEELELSGESFYGYKPLMEALAAKTGAPVECIVHANGTSMANHLVMAALLDAGDEVLIEHPAYELLPTVARHLRAEVKTFARRFEDGFRLDPSEVERHTSERTRLIILTNLHNPSSAFADAETLKQIGDVAQGAGARVLVDEVYMDALFDDAPPSAFHLGPQFVVTSSLTKVYGLSGLRCGWIVAEPELAAKIWRLNDLFGVIPAHAAERLSVAALTNLPRIAARARSLLEANTQLLNSFFETRRDIEWTEHRSGTVSFPRLPSAEAVEELCALLAEKYETSVVHGKFFEMPRHIRIGIGGETANVRAGLERLGAALDELGR